MINSLFKDSHITQLYQFQILDNRSGRIVPSNKKISTTVSNDTISLSKPAKINFSGLAGAKLAHNGIIGELINSAKEYLPKKAKLKDVKDFISNTLNQIINNSADDSKANKLTENIQTFLQNPKNIIHKVINEAENLIKEDEILKMQEKAQKKGLNFDIETIDQSKIDIDYDDVKKTIIEAIDGYTGLQEITKKGKNKYTNKMLIDFFKQADDKQPIFNAIFALGLTCFLRPLAILFTPGSKKNKDDKKYASAHSIASGIIGYVATSIFLEPVARATKIITNSPGMYSKNKETSYLISDKKALFAASTFLKMFSETLISPPKAILTIALIPLILEKVFHITKNKKANTISEENKMDINQVKTDSIEIKQNIKKEAV